MTRWTVIARRVIQEIHQALPEGATLEERKKAVDAAYPFDKRERWPYRAWLKARREYLTKYGYQPRLAKTPLEKMIEAARRVMNV